MTLREQIEAKLRQARLSKDEPTKNVIGMLKSKVLLELKSGAGKEENDGLWLEVLKGYVKQLKKTLAEFDALGERGKAGADEARFELAFCDQFLPKKLDEAATEAIVRQLASANNITDPKQVGRLMGLVMKAHKDEVDSDLVKQIATRILGG